jgi:hypothetical protein
VATATDAANGATDANTANALVKRDASGNFSAGTITGNLNGNATSITGTITGNQVTGNIAATQVNGALANATIAGSAVTGPIAGSQINGDITGNAASITGSITGGQVSSAVANATNAVNATNATNAVNASTVTNGVYTTGTYADPSFITSLAGNKITGSVSLADIARSVNQYTTALRPAAAPANSGQIILNTTTNTLQLSDGSNWTDIGAATPTAFTGNLAGDVTGTQGATVVSSVGGQTAAAVAGATTTLGAATDFNTANTLVKRDASGNFAAGTITAALNGNATSITGNISGTQVTGNISGNAASITGNITESQVTNLTTDLNAKANDNAVVHLAGTETIAGAKTFSSAGNSFTGSGAGLTSIPNSATTATSSNTNNSIVARDGSGNFSAGTITAALNGNASTATTATSASGLAAGTYANAVTFSNAGNSFTGIHSGNGAGLSNLTAGNISAGTAGINITGSAATATTAGNVSGIVAVANGGTGVSTTAANLVFASPNGASGAPTFRALVAADLPGASVSVPVNNVVATSQTTISTSFTDLASAGPSVAANISATGKALVTVTTLMSNGVANDGCSMGFAVSGATTVAASDAQSVRLDNNNGNGASENQKVQISATYLVTGLTAGSNTFTSKYRAVTGGTCTFVNRNIIVTPY